MLDCLRTLPFFCHFGLDSFTNDSSTKAARRATATRPQTSAKSLYCRTGACVTDGMLHAAVASRTASQSLDLFFRGTERHTGRGANRSPHDADGCDFVRAAAGSGQGRDRTADTRIFSPVLYRLSYLSEKTLSVTATTERRSSR